MVEYVWENLTLIIIEIVIGGYLLIGAYFNYKAWRNYGRILGILEVVIVLVAWPYHAKRILRTEA